MALELKDISTLIDLPSDIDTADKAKEYFSSNFVARKLITEDETFKKAIGAEVGRITGSITVAAARSFNLSKDEIKDKKIEEVLDLGATKFNTEITALKAGAGEPDKKVKEWETKYSTLEKDANSYKSMIEAKDAELTKTKEDAAKSIKQHKINFILTDAKAKVKLKDGINEAEKNGFNYELEKNSIFDLDENDKPIVLTSKGEKVKNAKGTDFVTLDEYLETTANKLGILKLNNGGAGGGTPPKNNEGNGAQQQANNGRQLAKTRLSILNQ